MKSKFLKVIIVILLIILILIILFTLYFLINNIKIKLRNDIKSKYDLQVENFLDRKIFVIKPKDIQKSDMKILYFHGGSYMGELTNQHWEFVEHLIDDTGATVILPDYPLTPKYNYRDVFNMVVPLYKEIEKKVDVANQLIVMGDSAGGGLSLSLTERLSQEENIIMPRKIILISPWLDVRMTNPDIDKIQEVDKKLNKETLKLAGIAYAGVDGINSYLVNPIDGDLSKLKNITIFIGTNDILNPDVHKLKKKAEDININIDVKEYKNAGHIWIIDKDSDEEITKKGYNDLIYTINEK